MNIDQDLRRMMYRVISDIKTGRDGIQFAFSTPLTDYQLVKEILDRIIVEVGLEAFQQQRFLVLYTIEFAVVLRELGCKHITVTTQEHCAVTQRLCDKLGVNYTLLENLMTNKKRFDCGLSNPPYTLGQKLLYTQFFEKVLDLSDLAAFVMPVNFQSNHDKLRKHNQLAQRHMMHLSKNVSEHFQVGYKNIHYLIASKSQLNDVEETKDPVENFPLLYPQRKRLVPIKGDTDIAIGPEVEDGEPVIFKVHKEDTVIYKKVDRNKVRKTNKVSDAKYLVVVNHTPSKGRFNCAILKNQGLPWSMWTFAFECDSIEQAKKLKKWIQSDEIVSEVKNMLEARNNQHTISKALIERLPTYE